MNKPQTVMVKVERGAGWHIPMEVVDRMAVLSADLIGAIQTSISTGRGGWNFWQCGVLNVMKGRKMPKLYEYLGISIFFYANEHKPIHVHGEYNGMESKAEIILQDGNVVDIVIRDVAGRAPLAGAQLKDFRAFVNHFANDIIQKWVDFFVYRKSISPQRITRRIR